ncbi:MAG: His/Gly/Thr/Pro-type tRNA ligase C-terminal domain-containing protein, partial [Bacillota bacterium]|nr:His/Gly/Thr/Pro-type tRNA ligase C-terminal domain-containing protein [Bacillota bacterium]
EGHTCHATDEEAQEETIKMLNVYADLCENILAIPVVKGQKTDKEKFAGAKQTYTIESLMHDGKALQTGTSHHLGDGFAKAFGIQFTDQEGKLQYVQQTSWGFTTRVIGAMIMVHGDDRGLVIPPKAAPTQVIIVPIAQHKEGVLDFAYGLKMQLSRIARIDIDASDKKPGWKFNEYEMKGIPVRLEVGPKDIENGQVVLARRDTGEKIIVPLNELEAKLPELLDDIQYNLYKTAKAHRDDNTSIALNLENIEKQLEKKPGFIKAMWCGDKACEDQIKERTGATSRCIPFEQERISETCVCCDKAANNMVYWAKAY